ncbi:ABC transporter permease [Maledivibacter halophilus]|uniref:MacB-like core domain-containing protein n=1 Tax=Maledivibacter halophilus TaxID=36842 RepID=A0A1T5MHH4_9FIRM|nr:ABC transporter permease [Maledivibacter halophilus]SKC87645.1 MacB-like core domain-containing protein [Maledivibacter halophilus]
MGLKRVLALFIMILALFLCSIYLIERYNPRAIEYHLLNDMSLEQFNKIAKEECIELASLNYIMPHKDYSLIMTTGYDEFFKNIDVIHGELIHDSKKKYAVIGDKVADKYFKTENSVGMYMNILGDKYEIVGVVKDSKTIYISYRKKLHKHNWKKIILRFTGKIKMNPNMVMENIDERLREERIDVRHKILYAWYINTFLNAIIIVLIFLILKFIKRIYYSLKENIGYLNDGYCVQKRSVEWYHYLIKNKILILNIIKNIVFIIISALIILKTVTKIVVSKYIIPENFFSLRSYIDVAKRLYDIWLYQMQEGFSDICICSTVLIIFLVTLVSILAVSYKITKN